VDLTRFRRLAREVDEQHRTAMRAIDEADPGAAGDDAAAASRRSFLRGLGLGGTALTVGATAVAVGVSRAGAQTTTTAGETTTTVPATTTTAVPKAPTDEDVVILVFAQSLELALVELYDAAISSGKLTEDVLPTVAAFREHHLQHAQAYAGLAGKAALNRPNQAFLDETMPTVEEASDQAAVLGCLFDLENAAANSYTAALAEVRGLNPATAMANILPIEARHAVVLGEALGLPLDEYVPAFEDPEQGLDRDQFPIVER
jgi:hypothetical protein